MQFNSMIQNKTQRHGMTQCTVTSHSIPYVARYNEKNYVVRDGITTYAVNLAMRMGTNALANERAHTDTGIATTTLNATA